MEVIRLDAAALTKRQSAFDALEAALGLPAWWGRNLDALHDCLTEAPRHIALRNRDLLEGTDFGRRLWRVLEEAAEENPLLELTDAPFRILFLCHGNICRSPMAEFVMKDLVEKAGLAERVEIASAATSTEEIGSPVYPPARRKLAEHGIGCSGKTARQMTAGDVETFDLLIGMDAANLRNMRRLWGEAGEGKVFRLMDFTKTPKDVADPWYTRDFEATWQDVSRGCRGLLDWLQAEI